MELHMKTHVHVHKHTHAIPVHICAHMDRLMHTIIDT